MTFTLYDIAQQSIDLTINVDGAAIGGLHARCKLGVQPSKGKENEKNNKYYFSIWNILFVMLYIVCIFTYNVVLTFATLILHVRQHRKFDGCYMYKYLVEPFSVNKQMRLSTTGASIPFNHGARSRNEFSHNSFQDTLLWQG